jgi:hypothetical protein
MAGEVIAIYAVRLGAFGALGDFWGGVKSWPSWMASLAQILERVLRGLWEDFGISYIEWRTATYQ